MVDEEQAASDGEAEGESADAGVTRTKTAHGAVSRTYTTDAVHAATVPAHQDGSRRPLRLEPGLRVQQYGLIEELGRGGMGQVFLARDSRLGRRVAIKFMRNASATITERFLVEARATAMCHHDNIVVIHEVGELVGLPFMVLEYLEGDTLREQIAAGPIPWRRAVELAVPIVSALVRAHEFDIVHRDLKPENVIVTRAGKVKVLDFGIAKTVSEARSHLDDDGGSDSALTVDGALVGTMAYMSPEQWQRADVDHRTDIWSVGLILYEMLVGERPSQGSGDEIRAWAQADTSVVPVRDVVADVPPQLDAIIARCLAKDRGDRYPDARSLLDALDALVSPLDEPPARRTAWLIGGAVAVAAALFAAAVMVVVIRSSGDARPDEPGMSPPGRVATGYLAPVAVSHRQITFTGNATEPTISPDGKSIVYSVSDAVWLIDVESGQQRVIHEADYVADPRFSADGSLLFTAILDAAPHLHTLASIDSPALATDVIAYRACRFPDGGLATIAAPWKAIKSYDANGDNKKIAVDGDYTWMLDIDCDERNFRAVVAVEVNDVSKLEVVSLADGVQRTVVESRSKLQSPRCPSDGSTLLYLDSKGGQTTLRSQAITIDPSDQPPPRAVMTGIEAGEVFSIADTGRIAYVRTHTSANVWQVPSDSDSPPRKITGGTGRRSAMSVSPDERLIAFIETDAAHSRILVMPLEGGQAREVARVADLGGAIAWSPDGTQLAFGAVDAGVVRVWHVDAAGGEPQPFEGTELSDDTRHIEWAPGEGIIYQRPGNQEFLVIDPRTGHERPLLRDPSVGWAFGATPSPDGRRVALFWNHRDRSGVYLVSVADGAETFLYDDDPVPFGWSLDGQWVYAFHDEDDRFLRIPAGGGEASVVRASPFPANSRLACDLLRNADMVCLVAEVTSDVWIVDGAM